jgi:2-methylisocitrate lyase-like PEP mutase family enzyme
LQVFHAAKWPAAQFADKTKSGKQLSRHWQVNMGISEKYRAFRALHQSGCFVIPNPWNVGSARYLQGLGFKALATTSAGFAHAQGYSDGDVTRDMMLAHFREIAQATDVPVNADFEGGYADDPDEVAENVKLCVATGVAGLSIEDYTGDDTNPLYDFDLAVKRVRATRDAIDKTGGEVVFTARTEGFIKNRPDLEETIRRLKAFADAGADCLYSPGIKTREHIAATVKAVAPKPINFLNSGAFGYTVDDLAALGIRRISVGGTLSRVAMHAFIQAARQIAQDGKFDAFAGVVSNAELNAFFHDDLPRRPKP